MILFYAKAFVKAYFGYLLGITMGLWLILCFGIFNGPICGTKVRWDYLFPARILACDAPKVDAVAFMKQGLEYMFQAIGEE